MWRRTVLRGRLKRSVRAVRLFGHLATLETHTLVLGALLLLDHTYFGDYFVICMLIFTLTIASDAGCKSTEADAECPH